MANGSFLNVTPQIPLLFKDFGISTVFYIILVILASWLLVRVISFVLHKVSEQLIQYRHPISMIIPLAKIIIYFTALYFIIFSLIEPDLTQLVAFFGLFGAGLGLGLKDLFADLIGGIVIIAERPYQIGDKITIGNYYGEVTDIGLRSTVLVTPDDSTVSVPNYLIFSQSVSSANAGALAMMVVIDLFIDPDNDTGQAMEILKEAVTTSKYIIISGKNPFTVLYDDFPFYRRIRAKAYVNDLRNEFEFKSEVTRRAWAELRKRGIHPPRIRGPWERTNAPSLPASGRDV